MEKKKLVQAASKDIVVKGEFSLDMRKLPRKRRHVEVKGTGNRKAGEGGSRTILCEPVEETPPPCSASCGEIIMGVMDSSSLYRAAVVENRGTICLHPGVHAVLGWDSSTKRLKKSEVLIVSTRTCSCDTFRCDFMHSIPRNLQAEADYPKCQHMELVESLKCDGCLAATDYLDDASEDVKLQLKDVQTCVTPLTWIFEDTFAVCSKDGSFGIVSVSRQILKCLTCKLKLKEQNCGHIRCIDEQLKVLDFSPDDDEAMQQIFELFSKTPSSISPYQMKVFSKKKIPFDLPSTLFETIKTKPSSHFVMSGEALLLVPPETVCSDCEGSLCDDALASEDPKLVVTRYEMFPAKCFYRLCTVCNRMQHFDGGIDCLLHIGNYLVHYEVLRDYMFQFFHARSTMKAFYDTWKQHQCDAGNTDFATTFSYNHFRLSWYGFRSLLDIQFREVFLCDQPSCGQLPDILIFDGTSIAFPKTALKSDSQTQMKETGNDCKPHKGSSFSERVYIKNANTRSLLKNFTEAQQITRHDYEILMSNLSTHKPVLASLCGLFGTDLEESTVTCPKTYKALLKVLSSSSSVCGTFPYIVVPLLEEILSLGPNTPVLNHPKLMKTVLFQIPFLYYFLSDIGSLSEILLNILSSILNIVKNTFSDKAPEYSEASIMSPLAFYPCLTLHRSRGCYQADRLTGGAVCSKKRTRHPTLLPGIFTVFCPHGICYGFEVMETCESPNIPFKFLKTMFPHPPKTVVYDNACNLHEYCLSRDPVYFRDTKFLVDRLHWFNHKSCAAGYECNAYPGMAGVNTQVVEQRNSKLRKLKSSLSYMREENFMASLSLFLWYSNRSMLKMQARGLDMPS